jgi:hypothetical protein
VKFSKKQRICDRIFLSNFLSYNFAKISPPKKPVLVPPSSFDVCLNEALVFTSYNNSWLEKAWGIGCL